ncbi:motility associated factor glycosyltransferase family protein [Solibacillus daqui]|uniref:motility associated factor glycosyltransferase family protein n=1 Tax=Solibacillus daqui TaxID=2912187 RepID=UPI002366D98D|nr:6-hydroxymethylpterin diphosphokinase MptE-like protein [Solibacillus daqui]
MGNIKIELAKSGEKNLIVNNINYYSTYNPKKDVSKYIASKIDKNCVRYIVIGLGLGYHIDELLIQDDKEIIVLETNQDIMNYLNENKILDKYRNNKRIKFVANFKDLHLTIKDCLIIIPAWKKHLQDEKVKLVIEQLEFEFAKGQNRDLMLENFSRNIVTNWKTIKPLENQLHLKTAILVAAGPDLDNQIDFLNRAQNKAYILCVSAAYQTLKEHNIRPNGIVAIDQRVEYLLQLGDSNIPVPLFALSTVHPSFTSTNNELFLLFQRGLDFVEQYAIEFDTPLIESHGSVATAGLSLLQYLGAEQIIFVGQDLAMHANKSHSAYSTSNYVVPIASRYKTKSNSEKDVETQLQWLIFKRHLEKMIENTPSIQYFNTSYNGAKIRGAEYKNSAEIII